MSMSKEKEDTVKTVEKENTNKDLIFIKDYVEQSRYPYTMILVALIKANQFKTLEMERTGVNNKPTLTKKELDDICKKYIKK